LGKDKRDREQNAPNVSKISESASSYALDFAVTKVLITSCLETETVRALADRGDYGLLTQMEPSRRERRERVRSAEG
jgi:hypothetical protein